MSAVQVHPSIYRVNAPFEGGGIVSCYLLVGNKLALVDTRVSTTPDQDLEPALRGVGIQLADVDLILNTHGHADHLGGNARVKEIAGADRVLEDGDRIDLGNDPVFSVVHTSGHTPGSVSFYWEKERVLLSGDSVQAGGSRLAILPLCYLADEYMRSQRKRFDLPIDMLCLGHSFGWSRPYVDSIRRGRHARLATDSMAVVEGRP